DCVDELPLSTAVDLVPEIIHVDVDHVCEGIEVEIPDVFGDHRTCQHTPRVAHEIFQKRILLARELNALSSSGDFACCRGQYQVTDLKESRRVTESSPQERPNPCQKLIDGKGFGEIVVRAGIQARYLLVHLRACGQDQYRDFLASCPQPLEHLESR